MSRAIFFSMPFFGHLEFSLADSFAFLITIRIIGLRLAAIFAIEIEAIHHQCDYEK